jgi:hypothetical protein
LTNPAYKFNLPFMNPPDQTAEQLSPLAKSFLTLLVGVAISFALLFLGVVSWDFSEKLTMPGAFLLLLFPIALAYSIKRALRRA